MTTIEVRLERLERAARRWRIAALSLAAAFAVLVSCQPGPPANAPQTSATAAAPADPEPDDLLRVRRLEVVDDGGQVLASLGVDPLLGAELIVFADANGQHTSVSGLGLSISDDEQTSVALMAVEPGAGSLSCPGPNGERATVDARGVRVYRATGRPGLNEAGEVPGEDEALAVVMGTTHLGGGILNVFSPLDEIVATVQSGKDNCGLVTAHDAAGQQKTALSGGE